MTTQFDWQMKYIPDAIKYVALLSIAIPLIILILVGLWVKIFFRRPSGPNVYLR